MKGFAEAIPADDRELVMTRIFKAPRVLVFKTWTQPEHIAQWWGPKDFTNPLVELDVRPGGAWRIHMQGPDGTIYPSKGTYREIVPPERLVMTDSWDQEDKPTQDLIWTVTFDEIGDETQVTIRVRCATPADRQTITDMGWRDGMSQSLDRLQVLLAAL